MRSRRQSSAAHWPFWLLIVAWFCANLPASAPQLLVSWLAGAKHFSHSATLRQSVSRLLASPKAIPSVQVAAADEAQTRHAPPPTAPTDTSLRKILFDPSSASVRLWLENFGPDQSLWSIPVPDEPVMAVPTPPPRSGWLV